MSVYTSTMGFPLVLTSTQLATVWFILFPIILYQMFNAKWDSILSPRNGSWLHQIVSPTVFDHTMIAMHVVFEWIQLYYITHIRGGFCSILGSVGIHWYLKSLPLLHFTIILHWQISVFSISCSLVSCLLFSFQNCCCHNWYSLLRLPCCSHFCCLLLFLSLIIFPLLASSILFSPIIWDWRPDLAEHITDVA